jgi:hypothetical protein
VTVLWVAVFLTLVTGAQYLFDGRRLRLETDPIAGAAGPGVDEVVRRAL